MLSLMGIARKVKACSARTLFLTVATLISSPACGTDRATTPAQDFCPSDGSVCRVMPLGDSITYGDGSSDFAGYRTELLRVARADSRALTYVGSCMSGPETLDNQPFPQNHEGHSGWTVDDYGETPGLYPRVAEWLTLTNPQVILLHIGTNDIANKIDLANTPARLGLLLDRIEASAPDAFVVVAQLVPSQCDVTNELVQTYNAAIPALVEERLQAGKRLRLVDMYSAFTSNPDYKTAYLKDLLHPNEAGYAVMANTWYSAIADLLSRPRG